MNIGISDALQELRPGATWSMDNQDYSSIQWNKDNSESLPSESDLLVKRDELRAAYDAQAYARNRRLDYPPVGDQLDMMMKDNRDGTTTHQAACETVKIKYPKPE